MSKYKALKELMTRGDGQLSAILTQVKYIEQLNHQFKQMMQQPGWQHIANEHYQVVRQTNHCLLIAADSAAYATKLRYESANLLSQWRQQFDPSLQRIELAVQPATYQRNKKVIAPTLAISTESITLLEKLAMHTKDISLKNSLVSLVSSAKQLKKE